MPWAYVIEQGRRGRWHVHLFLPSIPERQLLRRWEHGACDVKRLRHKADRVATALYVAKDFVRSGTEHRYEVAQGFAPEVVIVRAATLRAVRRMVVEAMGSEPDCESFVVIDGLQQLILRMTWDSG